MQVCTESFDVIDGQAILIQYSVYLCVSEVCCAVRAGLTHYWALGGKSEIHRANTIFTKGLGG